MINYNNLAQRWWFLNVGGHLSRFNCTTVYKKSVLQVGDRLPDINVYEKTPGNAVNIRELFKGKKGILFAVPGAFLPGCSLV